MHTKYHTSSSGCPSERIMRNHRHLCNYQEIDAQRWVVMDVFDNQKVFTTGMVKVDFRVRQRSVAVR